MYATVYIKNFRFLSKLNYKQMTFGSYYDFDGLYSNIYIPSTLNLYCNENGLYKDSIEWANILDNMNIVSRIGKINIIRMHDNIDYKPHGLIDYKKYENVYMFSKYLPLGTD